MVQPFLYVSVLFIHREGFWVAQSLERDLAAQGRTLDEAKHALEQTLVGQILFDKRQGREPLVHVPRAPDRYWEAFRRVASQSLKAEPLTLPDIPPAFMVQAITQANVGLH
jgi:hypothetical protein